MVENMKMNFRKQNKNEIIRSAIDRKNIPLSTPIRNVQINNESNKAKAKIFKFFIL